MTNPGPQQPQSTPDPRTAWQPPRDDPAPRPGPQWHPHPASAWQQPVTPTGAQPGSQRPMSQSPMGAPDPAHQAAPGAQQTAQATRPADAHQGYGQQVPAFYRQQVVPPPKAQRFRRGAVALVAASVLGAGLLGGVTGAVIGSDGASGTAASATTSNAAPLAATAATDVSAIAAKVMPSVVQITVRLGNAEGIGSGVVLSADGRILTNNHVVEGARDITVTFSDGKTASATVVGTDTGADLAVIQAEGVSGLTAATLGDSADAKVGDQVIAVGSPAGLQGTVTTGIISALDRDVNIGSESTSRMSGSSSVSYKAIQTDASINQGNSGGPLFDTAGRVIGINSAIYSPVSTADGAAGSVGIGFSIPIDTAKEVIARIS